MRALWLFGLFGCRGGLVFNCTDPAPNQSPPSLRKPPGQEIGPVGLPAAGYHGESTREANVLSDQGASLCLSLALFL